MRSIVNGLLIHEGSVLFARRSPHRKSYAGLWSFPGGHVEQNEILTVALVRELQEEIGITPTAYTHLGSIKDPNALASDPIVYHMYRVTSWEGGEPSVIGDEHSELAWKSFDAAVAMPDLALQEYRNLLARLR